MAVLCGDLHLSEKAPVARWREKDEWYGAMARALDELSELSRSYASPIICAGDVFDRWKASPALIHFALTNLPVDMHCIPGQHDLPYHSLENMNESAYGVLVKAGKIEHLEGVRQVSYMQPSPDRLYFES